MKTKKNIIHGIVVLSLLLMAGLAVAEGEEYSFPKENPIFISISGSA